MGNIISRAYGKEYRENLVDSLLSFNATQTWTVSAGLGSGDLDDNEAYAGDSCLKLLNTRPTTDTTITNSVQSTIIPFTGDYWLTLRLNKDQVDEIFTLEVKTFVGATDFNTQSFALGSETTADDLLVNDKWIPFMANIPFNLTKNDDVSFTFTLKGKAGTGLANTTIRIDGVKLEQHNTENIMPSSYEKPTYNATLETENVVFPNLALTTLNLSNATAPPSATDTGTVGEIRFDADYMYRCTATDTWKRVAIATW
jgi:hypothetical protein